VATERTGAGDPARSMALLWRPAAAQPRSRGPQAGLDVDRVVTTAVRLADRDGIGGLSMRRIAAALGVGVMTLYTYVPGKGELVDLMYDSVLAELYRDERPGDVGWRTRLEHVARENWALFTRHPWALHVATGRPPLGPHLMAKYERELRAVDGIGLDEVEMDLVVTLVNSFVKGTVSGLVERSEAERTTGVSDQQWWAATAPFLEQVFDPEQFPTAARVGPVAGEELQAAYEPTRSFEFGLERLLDGVAGLAERRRP